MQANWRLLALVFAAVVVLAILGIVVYLETPYTADRDRLADVEDREDVTLERVDGTVILSGGEVTEETVGIVLYPGARVHPESYAPTMAPIVAERDVVVVIPEMPLNLAVLDSNAADDVMDASPEVDRWVVGGHSLGGAMACRYTAENPAKVDGLLLFAAYCDGADDLGGTDVPVLSVQGTADGVIDAETERANRELLGTSARVVEIEGMNHAQFGAYGDQRGDRAATIGDDEATERLTGVVLEWLEELDERERGATTTIDAATAA